MQAVIAELMNKYYSQKEDGRIKDTKSMMIIEHYAEKLSKQELSAKTVNSLMVLKCLIMSGDDLPHDSGSAEGFQKAYRSWGVIYTRSIGSYDTIMWNLMHLDKLIWEVLEEEGII